MRLRRMLPLVSLAAILAWASVSVAFVEVSEWNRLLVPRPGWEDEGLWIQATERADAAKTSPVADLAAQYGGNWRYNRNSVTGSLHHVYGSGIDFTSALSNEADVERAARTFIGANSSLFGATNADLRAAQMQSAPGKWAAHFDQVVDGLRVVGGRVHAVFTDSGRLFAFGSDVYPNVKEKLGSTRPVLSEAEAIALAGAEVGFVSGSDQITHRELVILPIREARDDEMVLDYRLAWRLDLFAQNPYGHWSTYVDARSGEILWRESLIYPLDFTGHSRSDVEWDGYCDGYTYDFPVDGMVINISGVGTTYCGENGNFALSYGGTDSRTITAEFRGLYINVNRYTGTDASHTGTITPGTPYTIDWSNTNSLASERDCFSYINKQHRWLKNLDPTFTPLDYVMPCVVERTDGYCPGNAWYDYNGINFCVQSSSYGNTGRMGDVAYHEYGHGITHRLYEPTSPNSSIHEGNSDIVANLLTRESIIGLGFYLNNCTSGIRNSLNTLRYPDDYGGSGHFNGQIIAGFIWDSWVQLQAAYPQAYADSVIMYDWWYGRKMGLPLSFPDQVYWTFVADDNDGNLDNGTPHHAMLCVGAENHGFTCPEILSPVSITHTPVESQPSTTQPTAITATIVSSAAPINAGACRVYYKLNGGSFSNVGMSNVGGDSYTGYIPAQSAGTLVQYYIYGQDTDGNSATHPSNAPATLHGFYVGEFQTVFEDEFESAGGWTVGIPGDAATTGVWERGDPQGTYYNSQPVQPEDDHTPAPGVNCYATQLAAGSSAGSYDVDGGRTTLVSPVIDLSDAAMALVTYWRWYTNNLGNAPNEDYWRVQVSSDGVNWVYLENTTQSNNSWQRYQFNIGNYVSLTSTVQFRFMAEDAGSGSLVEAAVDDFKIDAILTPGIDPTLSTVAVNDDVMLRPDGLGDSVLAITVTVRDGSGNPVAGIPAGDVAVTLDGASLNGRAMKFCASGTDELILYSTEPTNASGEVTFEVEHAGGCGEVTVSAVVQAIALTNPASGTVRSPDLNGDGQTNFQDTMLYAQLLNAGTGYCGNLNGSPDGAVNFQDTIKYAQALAAGAACP
ncbi:MAG: hypothetical protein FJY73_07245 [Candidatus Eisenbacteria bacterium]|nr:hypothetical protein [Candidatus Eisenbacteria bacterium]